MISCVACVQWASVTIPFHLRPLAPPFSFPEELFRADERAKIAVLEVLRSLNCHFFFFLFLFFAETPGT